MAGVTLHVPRSPPLPAQRPHRHPGTPLIYEPAQGGEGRERALIVNVSSGLAFVPYPPSSVYSATKAALHTFTQALRVQLAGTSVTVIELAPPAVETPLLRGEFAAEMRGQRGMDVQALARRAIAGIEAGTPEIRPGLSNLLKTMSRIAPQLMLRQFARQTMPTTNGPTR